MVALGSSAGAKQGRVGSPPHLRRATFHPMSEVALPVLIATGAIAFLATALLPTLFRKPTPRDPGPEVRLQWRPETQGEIIDKLGDYIRPA